MDILYRTRRKPWDRACNNGLPESYLQIVLLTSHAHEVISADDFKRENLNENYKDVCCPLTKKVALLEYLPKPEWQQNFCFLICELSVLTFFRKIMDIRLCSGRRYNSYSSQSVKILCFSLREAAYKLGKSQ